MKRKLLFLIILILLFIGFIVIRFIMLEKENTVGRIRILSSPPAAVFIDNVVVGKTPYEEKVRVGDVMVKLIPEGEGSQIAPWQGNVKVYKNAMTYINRDLGQTDVTSAGEVLTITKMEKKSLTNNTGEVYVESEPPNAIIYLDNDEKGVSPLLLQNVASEDHEVSVFMPGFLRRTQKINVEAGYRVTVQFKLSLDPTHKTVDQTLQEKRQEASRAAEIAQQQAEAEKEKVLIGDTPVGFLRVRTAASIGAAEVAQVKPGETYELLEEVTGWYKIKLSDGEGWVSSQYASKQIGSATEATSSAALTTEP